MITDRYFLEIGIYRVPRERFDTRYDHALKTHLDGHAANYHEVGLEFTPERRTPIEEEFWRSYGGPWRYNQAIGWLRLFARGSEIRADLWSSRAKRFQRKMARQQLFLQGKAFEIWCESGLSSTDICSKLKAELCRFQAESWRGRFTLDLECFEGLSKHVDWLGLVRGVAQQHCGR